MLAWKINTPHGYEIHMKAKSFLISSLSCYLMGNGSFSISGYYNRDGKFVSEPMRTFANHAEAEYWFNTMFGSNHRDILKKDGLSKQVSECILSALPGSLIDYGCFIEGIVLNSGKTAARRCDLLGGYISDRTGCSYIGFCSYMAILKKGIFDNPPPAQLILEMALFNLTSIHLQAKHPA